MVTEITYRGVDLEVHYAVIKPSRGARDDWGAPLEPDWPGGVELERVFVNGADITDLLDGQFRAIEKVIMEGEPDADYD